MPVNNYPIGSILNPFNIIEYWDMRDVYNNWTGGWVKPNPDVITYYSANNTTYGYMGSRSNPYPNAIFNELSQNGRWVGGWVQTENGTTMYNNIYPNVGDTQETAASMDIYVEMSILGIWFGGWVSMDEGMRYVADPSTIINNDEGSGSEDEGCGCGSEDEGCGCGCGCEEEEEEEGASSDSDSYIKIKKGNVTLSCTANEGFSFDLKISWKTGYYNLRTGECTSLITLSLINPPVSNNSSYDYEENSFQASASWYSSVTILVAYSFRYCHNGIYFVYSSSTQVGNGNEGSEA